MATYEVIVERLIEAQDQSATVVVRARSEKAARAKALRIVKEDADTWFGPPSEISLSYGVADCERLDFEPDCVVL